jgi:hypothetical protein
LILGVLLFLITGGLLLLRIGLFLTGLLIITGGLVTTGGFVVGSTRGLELLRIICFCIGDAVFGKYVRLSDVLPSETKMDLDLLELEIKERFLYEDLRPYTFPKYQVLGP